MRVTKWGEYGILCSLYLAEQYQERDADSEEDPSIGAAEIAESKGIPLQYAHQILRRLRQGNIIASHRGPHGGYRLSRSPHDITLRQVLEAAEGDTFEVMCEANPVYDHCKVHDLNCALRPVWEDLKKAVNAFLDERTLSSVLKAYQENNQNPTDGLLKVNAARLTRPSA